MVLRMIWALTWQTLTLVTTVWAIADQLSVIETNSVAPPAAHDRQQPDSNQDGGTSDLPRATE